MAALTAEVFAALQSLLKASSKDVVRQLCQESFSSSALGSKKLLDVTCSSLSVTQEEAKQLLQALHRLTRLVVFRDLSSAEAVLALFPENFHQNLKNLLTKIILEHASTWRAEAQTNQISLPRLVDLDWRVDIKTSSDSISRVAIPTCLLQMKVRPLSCSPEGKEGQQGLGAPAGQQKCQTPSFRISNPINKKNLAPPKCSVYLESICVLT
ncbi:COMM domain-containing protein 9 isoform X1 [Monodon monoceros]|uniref:COMM domain-containing protein 9 isoform X1 n=1 Tax=Monodon monoceros TaxID=40151 RepID=UPI0010F6C3BF|nr:COMM domain-containing protein 9 isoform X1 [Monodon monoceros]